MLPLVAAPVPRPLVDDHRLVEQLGQLADAGLHAALVVPGGVVVGVLVQVAELPGRLDGAGDVDPAPGGKVLQLGLEPLVGGSAKGGSRTSFDATVPVTVRFGYTWIPHVPGIHSRNHVAHVASTACARPSTWWAVFFFPRQVGGLQGRCHRRGRHRARRRRRGPEGRCGRRASTSTPSTTTSAAPGTCAPARSCPTPSSTSSASSTPSCWARSARPGPARRHRAGPAAAPALRARPLRQPAPVRGAGHRLRRREGEHRGPLRRRGRRPAQGHAARGGHPGLGQHPAWASSAACASPSTWPPAVPAAT